MSGRPNRRGPPNLNLTPGLDMQGLIGIDMQGLMELIASRQATFLEGEVRRWLATSSPISEDSSHAERG